LLIAFPPQGLEVEKEVVEENDQKVCPFQVSHVRRQKVVCAHQGSLLKTVDGCDPVGGIVEGVGGVDEVWTEVDQAKLRADDLYVLEGALLDHSNTSRDSP
jgi:hypothetical protein